MPDFLLALAVRTFNAVLGFISLLIVARHFGPGGKGIITEALLPATTLLMVFKLGIDYASVMVLKRYKERTGELLGGFLVTTALVVAFVFFLQSPWCAFFWDFCSPVFPEVYLPYIYIALWLFPAQLFHDACLNAILGSYNFRVFTWVKLIQPIVFFLNLALLWSYDQWIEPKSFGLTNVLWAYSISYWLSSIVMFLLLWRVLPLTFRHSFSCLKHLVVIGSVIQLVGLLIYLNRRLDVWMIAWLLDSEDNGVYSVVVSFLEVAWFVSKPLSSLVLVRSASNYDPESTGRILKFSMFVSTLYLILLSVGAPWLLSLAGPDFVAPGLWPLWLLVPGVLMLNIHQILSQVLYASNQGHKLLLLIVVALLLNGVLNVYLIEKWQLAGAAMASSLSYTLIAFGVLARVCTQFQVKWPDLLIPTANDFSILLTKLKSAFIKS